MGSHCLLHAQPAPHELALGTIGTPEPDLADLQGWRRAKIWDLSPSLHCSIVGTCLSASELRQFFVRFGDFDARTASDHTLHGRGVQAALRRDDGGKFLNKTLDKRHEAAIRRFHKARTAAELSTLWAHALDQGDIAGPYWALLTHPAADGKLVQKVFGDVHMLSHQVGAAARLDIARLRGLERELGERDDKISRQEARLRIAARERETMRLQLEQMQRTLASRDAPEPPDSRSEELARIDALRRELDSERAHAVIVEQKWRAAETRLAKIERDLAERSTEVRNLRHELFVLEEALDAANADEAQAEPEQRLRGARVLYVGGRPRLFERLEAYVSSRGGVLLTHDGGIEDNATLLPGLISQADVVFLPIDCVSHAAAEQVKRLCGRLAKSWIPLRSASLASFAAQISICSPQSLRQQVAGAD